MSSERSVSSVPHDPYRLLMRDTDRIVDDCAMACAGLSAERLREIAEEADRKSDGKSWLAHMIRDYLETWRQ